MLNWFKENIEIYLYFLSILNIEMVQKVEFMEDKDQVILHTWHNVLQAARSNM